MEYVWLLIFSMKLFDREFAVPTTTVYGSEALCVAEKKRLESKKEFGLDSDIKFACYRVEIKTK